MIEPRAPKSRDEVSQLSGSCNPWMRGDWEGRVFALDGAEVEDIRSEDVDEGRVALILGDYADEGWDGSNVGLVQLLDGRYVGWETSHGPTGDGFSADAYGGTADIFVAMSFEVIFRFGFSDEGRSLMGFGQPGPMPWRHEPIWEDDVMWCVDCSAESFSHHGRYHEAISVRWPCEQMNIDARADTLELRKELADEADGN